MISPSAASALCRDAADRVRKLADEAAHDLDGDTLHGWDFERIGGVDRVVAVRQFSDVTDQEIVAVPLFGGVAGHLALWDPVRARAVADVLEGAAVLIDTLPPAMGIGSQMSLTVRMAEVLLGGAS